MPGQFKWVEIICQSLAVQFLDHCKMWIMCRLSNRLYMQNESLLYWAHLCICTVCSYASLFVCIYIDYLFSFTCLCRWDGVSNKKSYLRPCLLDSSQVIGLQVASPRGIGRWAHFNVKLHFLNWFYREVLWRVGEFLLKSAIALLVTILIFVLRRNEVAERGILDYPSSVSPSVRPSVRLE